MNRLLLVSLVAVTLATPALGGDKQPKPAAPAAPATPAAKPTSGSTPAQAPTAEALLKRYDELMGPFAMDSEASMTSFREDGSSRTYKMRYVKPDNDKFRVWFDSPAQVKGQEMLRSGKNMWVYLPNLKRSMRIANRDSFQGGDFNNADVLRPNYVADYTPKLVDSGQPDTYLLELTAKHADTAYNTIKLWLRKSDWLPVRGQYFATSGQLLRTAEFSDVREFEKDYSRPAKVVMHNELVKARRSELIFHSIKRTVQMAPQKFTQNDLGR